VTTPPFARERDAVRVSGPQAGSYLQSQATQDLAPLAVGASTWTFFLQPTGRIDVLVKVTREADDSFVLDTDTGYGDALVARLRRFFIRVDATIEPLGTVASGVEGDDLEAERVAAGWPAMGREIVPGEVIPAETGIVPLTVNFRKGCYPGQELVERMDSRGARAPRELKVVAADAVPEGLVPTSVAGGRALVYVPRG
jgi:folate-binding protein YgfZ